MRWGILIPALLVLAGCDTTAATQQAALAQVEAHCRAEGKVFVYGDTTKTPVGVGLVSEITVSGHCLTPAELEQMKAAAK